MVHVLARSLRLAIYWLELAIFTAIMWLLAWLPRALLDKFYTRLFFSWCRAFVRALDVDLRLHQKNRRQLPRHFILIANHPSAFEDIGIPALFNVLSLAKAEVRDWWIAGRIVAAAGNLFVKREERESRREAADRIMATLRAGASVAIYPEGGCKGRRIFSSFRFGAFDISLRTGIPIVPVFLHYESQADFEWAAPHTLIHKMWHFLRTQNNRANYYVYDAIDPAQFADKHAYNAYVHGLYLAWQARYLD